MYTYVTHPYKLSNVYMCVEYMCVYHGFASYWRVIVWIFKLFHISFKLRISSSPNEPAVWLLEPASQLEYSFEKTCPRPETQIEGNQKNVSYQKIHVPTDVFCIVFCNVFQTLRLSFSAPIKANHRYPCEKGLVASCKHDQTVLSQQRTHQSNHQSLR